MSDTLLSPFDELSGLELGKLAFEEIMREFPQIPINICKVFSRRIRETQEKLLNQIKQKGPFPRRI